jgi:hypothetical protein
MSMREADRPMQTSTGERRPIETHRRPDDVHETKASFKTTEMWAAIVGVVALIVVYNASSDQSFDLFRACLLCTLLGAAYIISRGLAKSASRPERSDWNGRATPY